MAGSESLQYFLFPHLTLSETDVRKFYIFLPRLDLMEISKSAQVPQWGRQRFSSWRAIREDELVSRINSCIQEYHAFAEVHGGGGGTMGYLSQVLDEMETPRYRIQEELRGKCPRDMDEAQKELFRAAVFLEIARELDERELELESSYSRLNAIEREFREILGVSEEEEGEAVAAAINGPLTPDRAALLYMLPKRAGSWLRLLAFQRIDTTPVFAACYPEVIEETLEMIRAGCERSGKDFSPVRFDLGSVPALDGLGHKQFRTLIEAPGISDLLLSYWRGLDSFIRETVRGTAQVEPELKIEPLRQSLEKICRSCDSPVYGHMSLSLTFLKNLSLADIFEVFGITGPASFDAPTRPVAFLCID